MDIQMQDVNELVRDAIFKVGLEYNLDNRIAVLADFAKKLAYMEEFDPIERTRIALYICVEIVRLRTEKQMFGL